MGTVIVTGVSSGIGAAVARCLAAAGYFVFGSVRSAQDATSLSDSLGAQFKPLVFDVRDKAAVLDASQEVEVHLKGKPLRGLVNNAGFAAFGPMECLDDMTFDDSIAVNLSGTRVVTNAFLPLLRKNDKEQPGQIINISSLSGILNTPMNGAYCVAKHALESLGEVYRRELMPDGIDVVSLRSGPVRSEIWNKAKTEVFQYELEPYNRMARNARVIMANAEKDAIPAEDIGNAVVRVLSGQRNRTAYHFSKGALAARILAVLPKRRVDRVILRSLMKEQSFTPSHEESKSND